MGGGYFSVFLFYGLNEIMPYKYNVFLVITTELIQNLIQNLIQFSLFYY